MLRATHQPCPQCGKPPEFAGLEKWKPEPWQRAALCARASGKQRGDERPGPAAVHDGHGCGWEANVGPPCVSAKQVE